MKYCIVLFFIITNDFQQPEPSIRELRQFYLKASTERLAAENLQRVLSKLDANAPVTLVCYKGVANMLMAKYGSNPISKYRQFSAGRALITRAVSKDTSNIEARLLRFTMQYHAPAFLGYNSNLAADRYFLAKNLLQIKDVELKKMVEKMLSLSKSE